MCTRHDDSLTPQSVWSQVLADTTQCDGRKGVTMPYRPAVVVAVLLVGLIPTSGEAATRMSFSIAKSFHPKSDRNYSTTHPGLGATGWLVGRWLRWRAGLVRALTLALGAVHRSRRHVEGDRELATGSQRGDRRELPPRTVGAPRSSADRAVEGPRPRSCLGVWTRASRAGDVRRIERADPNLGVGNRVNQTTTIEDIEPTMQRVVAQSTRPDLTYPRNTLSPCSQPGESHAQCLRATPARLLPCQCRVAIALTGDSPAEIGS